MLHNLKFSLVSVQEGDGGLTLSMVLEESQWKLLGTPMYDTAVQG